MGEVDRIAGGERDAVGEAAEAPFFARSVVLVEGTSDLRALEALALRRGRDLDAERVAIVPIGGATNIGHFLALVRPEGIRPAARRAVRRG